MPRVALRLLALSLALTLTGCYGAASMVKQARVLRAFSGGPREGWNTEEDYKDCNMRVGSTTSRLFSAYPPSAVYECMRDRGYTVNPPKGRSMSSAPADAPPLLPAPTWDTGL